MPPRYAYWTILAGGLPTSFRAAAREDLLPTLKRLAATHPDAELKWFARGRLWISPEAAREAARAAPTGRGRDWRPGGDHRDPRQAFTDARKARNAERRQQRFARKQGQAAPGKPARKPTAGGPAGKPAAWRPTTGRPAAGRHAGHRPNRPGGSPGSRPRGPAPGGPSRGPARPGQGPRGPRGPGGPRGPKGGGRR